MSEEDHARMIDMDYDKMIESKSDVIVIEKEDWKEQIEKEYTKEADWDIWFHDKIWEMSLTAFDIAREVQVVIDSNDKLFISVGSPGFVSFEGQEDQLPGMKLPLKEWIHTHPFGSAYFSATDLKTIGMWERYLEKATVLGDKEEMTIFFRVGPDGEHFQEYSQFNWIDEGEEE